RVDNGHEPVAAKALEVAFDELARLSGLRAARFPAGPGQRRLDFRSEDAEHDSDHEPRGEHRTEVRRGPAAHAADRTNPGPDRVLEWRGGCLTHGGRDRAHGRASWWG